MRVITMNKCSFLSACNELKGLVLESGFSPDVVISIASGGCHVADRLDFYSSDRLVVTLKRKTTETKEKFKVAGFLRFLPYFVLDFFRVLESFYLGLKGRENKVSDIDVRIIEGSISLSLKGKDVLVVDDAVDGGLTMATVLQAVKRAADSTSNIRSAVMVLTTPNPMVHPDYVLHKGVLLRFPWSKDFKG